MPMDSRIEIEKLRAGMAASIIGQEAVVERLPGSAKTRAIKALAKNIEADFSRVQFTPDLLPSDVTGRLLGPLNPRQVQQ